MKGMSAMNDSSPKVTKPSVPKMQTQRIVHQQVRIIQVKWLS